MANTYTQLYAQTIFAVKHRQNFIHGDWKSELYRYITGIVTNKGQKIYSIGGTHDHIHILIGFNPVCSLSYLIRDIKANSSGFVNSKHLVNAKFQWQTGYGAFTYSHSQVDNVVKYIMNQEEHHRHKSFREEYIQFLENFDVDYNPIYLFEFYE